MQLVPVATIDYQPGAEGTPWAVYFGYELAKNIVNCRFAFLRDAERYIIDCHRKINLTVRAANESADYQSDFGAHYN